MPTTVRGKRSSRPAVWVLSLTLPLCCAHWLCNDSCPLNPVVYSLSDPSVHTYESGNCFSHLRQRYAVTHIQCGALCLMTNCVHAVMGDDGCVLLGHDILSLPSRGIFRPVNFAVSELVEVAHNKPVSASSVNFNVNVQPFQHGPEKANDGKSPPNEFFLSNDGTSDSNPSLLIDLQKNYVIHQISFIPRTYLPGEDATEVSSRRGENITIYVGNFKVNDGNFEGVYETLLFIRRVKMDPIPGLLNWSYYNVTHPKCGRYLAVKKELTAENPDDRPLEITEIMVFTSPNP